MYIKIKGVKINIIECTNFKSKFKSFKFYLEKIDYGLYFPRKKIASTYFFCQRVDICFTDKNNKIISLHSNVRSEKFIFKLKAKNIYYLPVGYSNNLSIGETIKIYN